MAVVSCVWMGVRDQGGIVTSSSSTTDFWITPAGLDDQARAFDHAAELISTAATFVGDHRVGDAAEHPLYQGAATKAQHLGEGLVDFLGHVNEVLLGVSTELRSVATESRELDLYAEARLDAFDPTEYNGFDSEAPGRESAYEIAPDFDRTDELLFPVYPLNGGGVAYYCAADGRFDHINAREAELLPGDLLSPSEWVATILGWLGAESVKERLLDIFGGRWIDLYEFQYMLAGISRLIVDVRDNLKSAVSAIGVYWQGYAANSAQEYFELLLAKLTTAATRIDDAANAFGDFIAGVESEFDALSGAAHGFIDAVLIAAGAFATALATAPTVVGEPIAIGGGIVGGAALIACMIQLKQVWDIAQNVMTVLDLLSAIEGLSADLGNVAANLTVPAMEET